MASEPAYRFRRLARLTLLSVYVLILVGGIVRGTGAGMGCPDWPKCFGRWVPPTSTAELPADYKETYRQGRIAKNQRVAERLDRMGFHDVADNIFRHPASFIETDFNVTKTWIEYVNRLVGAIIGLLIMATFACSWPLRRTAPRLMWASALALLTVGVQGWLGSLVVSTNLVPAIVTWHMALALVLLLLLHYVVNYHHQEAAPNTQHSAPNTQHPTLSAQHPPPNTQYPPPTTHHLNLRPEGRATDWLSWGFIVLVFAQIIIGTQVRENIDVVASQLNYLNRDLWIERLGPEFGWHRAFSTLLLLAGVWVAYRAWATGRADLRARAGWLLGLLVLNPLVGFGLTTFAVPAVLQPVHLVVGTALFGAAVEVALAAGRRRMAADGAASVAPPAPASQAAMVS